MNRSIYTTLCAAAICMISLLSPTQVAAQDMGALLQQAEAMGLTTEELIQLQQQMGGSMMGSGASSALSGGMNLPSSLTGGAMSSGASSSKLSMDTAWRQEMSLEELDKINPVLLERAISRKIDSEGEWINQRPGGSETTGMLMGEEQELSGEELEEGEYEIVIKDGEYIKRPLPKVFGREIFTNQKLTFTPNYQMATPPSYILGTNDQVLVEVWGNVDIYEEQKITPDGNIYLEGVGPIKIGGLTVESAQKHLASRLSQSMSGLKVSLTVTQIRSIKVNITGEVSVPGTYTLPSLSSLFHALYAAGGVNRIGSLREVKLYRGNEQIASFDVYDFLLRGEYGANVRLEDDDVIIVPPYQNLVRIGGEVKRERLYELKAGETLQELIDYAGGFTGSAYTTDINVWRKGGTKYSIYTVEANGFDRFAMQDADSVVVDASIAEYTNRLSIQGAVWRSGEFELSEQTNTLSELIERAGGLRGDEFAARGQISRRNPDFTWEVVPFDVRAIVTGSEDMALQAEDRVYIPNILELREAYTVTIRGEVNAPATLPYMEGMSVKDLILRAGGLKESASLTNIEVARRVKDPYATDYSPELAELFNFAIDANLAVDPAADRFVLHPFDVITVRPSPGYSVQQSVSLVGEVLHPGSYTLAISGERLSEVLTKAGGITPEAYLRGASVQRLLTDDEKARAQAMMSIALNNESIPDAMSAEIEERLGQPFTLGVDVEEALRNPGSNSDIVLRDGDIINIPLYNSTVKISGSILYPNTVTYDRSKIKHYISQAGGYNEKARRRPFIVYMNGEVASTRTGFLCKRYPKVEPGCEIVVPQKVAKPTSNLMSNIMGMTSASASLAAVVASVMSLTQ